MKNLPTLNFELNRKQAPEIKNIEKLNLSFPDRALLDNGIPLYIINAGEQEVVKIEFILKAGINSIFLNTSNLTLNTPLIPKLTLEMLTEGTESFTSEEIAETLDFYGAFLDRDCDRDKATLTITCQNKHLKNIIPVLKEMIFNPTFPASNFQLISSNKRQHFILNNEKVAYVAKQKFKQLLYGDSHPYGSIIKVEDFDNLEREHLKVFHSANYQASAFSYIIISGKPDKNIISVLNKHFGNVKCLLLNAEVNIPNSELRIQNSKLFIQKPAAIQSAIRIGKVLSAPQSPILNYKSPDYYCFKILNTILGGYFGSRLMSNIREDKGYTYGISSNVIPLYNSAYFFITSQIGVEHVNIAISEIYKEMKRLQNDKVKDKELELVRNYMQGNLLRSMDGPFAIAELCKILIEYGLSEDYFEKYIDNIQNITSDEIIQTAQKYLQPLTMTELIVGNR
jgi:zinc protease